MLSGHIGIFEGRFAIANLSIPLDRAELEDVLRFFTIIAGEADDFPMGEVRKLWDSEALRIKDAEAADYERRIRTDVLDACYRLRNYLEADGATQGVRPTRVKD